jgi:hypothetical protein
MSNQLTSVKTCRSKQTYYSGEVARRAKKRRNKAAGINYLRAYKCNVCTLWHLTTKLKEPIDERTHCERSA